MVRNAAFVKLSSVIGGYTTRIILAVIRVQADETGQFHISSQSANAKCLGLRRFFRPRIFPCRSLSKNCAPDIFSLAVPEFADDPLSPSQDIARQTAEPQEYWSLANICLFSFPYKLSVQTFVEHLPSSPLKGDGAAPE